MVSSHAIRFCSADLRLYNEMVKLSTTKFADACPRFPDVKFDNAMERKGGGFIYAGGDQPSAAQFAVLWQPYWRNPRLGSEDIYFQESIL
eukprot:1154317-Pelagomonas_calceolata.AAC.8